MCWIEGEGGRPGGKEMAPKEKAEKKKRAGDGEKVSRSGVGRELARFPRACGISEPGATHSTLHPTSDLQLSNQPTSSKPSNLSLSLSLSFVCHLPPVSPPRLDQAKYLEQDNA